MDKVSCVQNILTNLEPAICGAPIRCHSNCLSLPLITIVWRCPVGPRRSRIGTWNDGGLASIRIPLDPVPAGEVRVMISGTAFVNERLSTQLIKINAGGQEIDSWVDRFPQQTSHESSLLRTTKLATTVSH